MQNKNSLMKRLLSLALLVVIVCTMIPTTAVATGKTTEKLPTQSACLCDTRCTKGTSKADCPVCNTEHADVTDCKGVEGKNTEGTDTSVASEEITGTQVTPYFSGNELFAVGHPLLLLEENDTVQAYWDKNGDGNQDAADEKISTTAATTEASNWAIYGGREDTPMTADEGSQITLLCGGVQSVSAGSKVGGDAAAAPEVLRIVRIGTTDSIHTTDFNSTQYKVTFDAQQGDYGTPFVWQAVDAALIEPSAAPTREKHTFMGFYDAISGGAQYYRENMDSAIETFTETKPVTLYAKWSEGKGIVAGRFSHYQVFDCRRTPDEPSTGGSFHVSDFKPPYDDASDPAQSMLETDVAGRIFYFKVTEDTNNPFMLYMAQDIDGAEERPISGQGKIFALGKEGFLFVSYGTWKGYFISISQGFDYGGELTYTPTKGEAISKEEAEQAEGISPTPWNPRESYAVTFDSQEADKAATPNRISVRQSTINATIGLWMPTIPTKIGFNFGGWYTEPDGAGTVVEKDTVITADMTVYAKWEISPIQTVKIEQSPQLAYEYGDYFDPQQLILKVTYENNITKQIPYAGNETKFIFSPATNRKLQLSDKQVAFTYQERNTTYPFTLSFTVSQKTLTPEVTGVTGKIYDGNTSIQGASITVEDGVIEGDQVTVIGNVFFEDKHVGQNKKVKAPQITIQGTDASKYQLAYTALTGVATTAEITAKPITLVWTGGGTLIYTGTAKHVTATISTGGVVAGDVCNVLVTGGAEVEHKISNYTATATVTNTDYSLVNPTHAYNIGKANMSGQITVEEYTGEYDGAAHGIAVTAPAGATITYTNNHYTNAGTYVENYTVTHANYEEVTGQATVTIRKKRLTPTLNATTVQDKEYNKTKEVSVIGIPIVLQGIIGTEAVQASASIQFIDGNVGKQKAVHVTNISLTGAAKDNYELATQNLENVKTNAEISPRVAILAWNPNPAIFPYDGSEKQVIATVSNRLIEDDCNVIVTGGSATIPGSYTASATRLSNANYQLPTAGISYPFTVSKAAITGIVAIPTNKTYDGVYVDGVIVTGQRPTDEVWYSTIGANDAWSKEIPQVGVEGSSTDIWVKVERVHYNALVIGKVTAVVRTTPKVKIDKPIFDATDIKRVTVGGMVTEGGNPIVLQKFELRKIGEKDFTRLTDGITSGKQTTYKQMLTNLTEDTQYELRLTATDQQGVIARKTLQFRTQAKHPAVGEIIGDVAGGIGEITVTLEFGNTVIASIGHLKSGDTFSFKQLPEGEYNLVATDSGNKHVTRLATVKKNKTTKLTTMTIGLEQSAVEIKGEAPPIAVDGLQGLFDSNTYKNDADATNTIANGGTVEIRLTAKEAKEQTEIDEIQAGVGSDIVSLLIDLKVDMLITSQGAPSTVKNLQEVDGLLTIAIPLPQEATGKSGYKVYRYHNGKVEALTQIYSEADKAEGTFRVTEKYIYMYASKFSTYAMTYEQNTGDNNYRYYNIHLNAGTGGSFSPNKTKLDVREGDSFGVDIIPEEGYNIGTVIVNGKDMGAISSYVGTNVRSDYTIAATFTKQVPPTTGEYHTPIESKKLVKQRTGDRASSVGVAITDPTKQSKPSEERKADNVEHSLKKVEQKKEEETKELPESFTNKKKPFVLASALLLVAAIAMALVNLRKRNEDKKSSYILAIGGVAASLLTFLLTSGWEGILLANIGTLLMAAFTALTAYGVMSKK